MANELLATVLLDLHSYSAEQLATGASSIRTACVGVALKTIAQKLGLSPSAMQEDATDDGAEHAAEADLIGCAMELGRLYKEAMEQPAAAVIAAGGGGAAAATASRAALPNVMALDPAPIAALAGGRGGSANAPGANGVLLQGGRPERSGLLFLKLLLNVPRSQARVTVSV